MAGVFRIKDGVLEEYTGKGRKALIPEGVKVIGRNALKSGNYTLPETLEEIEEQDPLCDISFDNIFDFLKRGGKIHKDIMEKTAEKILSGGAHIKGAAGLYLFSSYKNITDKCKAVLDKKPGNSFALMADWLAGLDIKADKTEYYKKAVDYALEHAGRIRNTEIKRLHETMCANKAEKAAKPLIPYLPYDRSRLYEETIPASSYDTEAERRCYDLYNELTVNRKLKGLSLPAVKYRDGTTAPEFVVKCIFYAYSAQLASRPRNIGFYRNGYSEFTFVPEADKIAEALDPESLQQLIAGKAEALVPEDMFIFAPLCRYADGRNFNTLARKMPAWSDWHRFGSAGRAAIMVMRGAMFLNETREAMLYMEKVNLLYTYAHINKVSAQLLQDTVMLGIELDESGGKLYDLGGTVVKVSLDGSYSVVLSDASTGRALKALPKKNADGEKFSNCSADLKVLKKNVKRAVVKGVKRLHDGCLSGTAIPISKWKKIYMGDPVMRRLAATLVWQISGKKTCFIPAEGGGFLLSDGKGFTLPDIGSVGLAHPAELTAGERQRWKEYLSENRIAQAFTQMYEPVYDIPSIAEKYRKAKIPFHVIRSLDGRGFSIGYEIKKGAYYLSVTGGAVWSLIIPHADEGKEERGCVGRTVKSIRYFPDGEPVFLERMNVYDKSERKINHDIYLIDMAIAEDAVRCGRKETLEEFSFCITGKNIDEFIAAALEAEQGECLEWLKERKEKDFSSDFPDFTLG